jgi:hypothetical protein
MDKPIELQRQCNPQPSADSALPSLADTLRRRLKVKGLEGAVLTGYLRDLANILAAQSLAPVRELNSRLRLLGWDDLELDDYTLELVKAVLDPKSDYVAPHWYDTITHTEKFDSMDDMTESLARLERGLFGDLHE